MRENDNLIFDSYNLYLNYFEPYTYRLKFQDPTTKSIKELELVSPKDRFPHLVGLSTIFPGESASDSIEYLDNNDNKYLISNISKSFGENFKNVKTKIIYFNHLANIFNNIKFYEVHSIPNSSVTGEFILLNKFNKIEINLLIDKATSEDLLGFYIPKSYLINYRPKYYGKFVSDSTLQELIRLDKIENSTGSITTLFYDELKDKNNYDYIKIELSSFDIPENSILISSIISFNNILSKYHTINDIINLRVLKSSVYSDNKDIIDKIIHIVEELTSSKNINSLPEIKNA